MDPLSVSASVVGVLGAAAKISSVLITFVQNTKGAPRLAQAVLNEVNGLSAILTQLQIYLLGAAAPSKTGGSLILVEQVIVTLTECVTTFSELEDVLGTSNSDRDMSLLDRVRWTMKESRISEVQERLQRNKSSLNLMLTILQCNSMSEAESAITRLCSLVEQVLASNQEMSLRLRNMDEKSRDETNLRGATVDDNASTTSTIPAELPTSAVAQGAQRNHVGFAFEEDLLASRAYRKPLYSNSEQSLVTSAARTTASSVLSALSLTEVSNISILAVPIYAHEISNSHQYNFGDFSMKPLTALEIATKPSLGEASATSSKPSKWGRFASAVSFPRREKFSKPQIALEQGNHILGVPITQSIEIANVATSLTSETGVSYVAGYIPTFLGKPAVFLKERATDVENIFLTSGSVIRLRKLERIFDSPPRFGKGLDWTGYTVHDAAGILLRYLHRLPEPIIPLSTYEGFIKPLRLCAEDLKALDMDTLISEYQARISDLPSTNRQILLYLLDLFAVFASRSERNKVTSARLATAFQPAILSSVEASDQHIEGEYTRRLNQDVLIFLIENQEDFLISLGVSPPAS